MKVENPWRKIKYGGTISKIPSQLEEDLNYLEGVDLPEKVAILINDLHQR